MIEDGRPFYPGRLIAVMAVFCAWSLLIAGRSVQFQVFHHKTLSALAVKTHEKSMRIPAFRGTIYDSQMAELASSIAVSNITANPSEIKNVHALAATLGPVLGIDPASIANEIAGSRSRKHLILAEKVLPDTALHVKNLKLNGIYLEDESLRVYPNRNLASHLLGFVNKAGVGAAGLESRYNKELEGRNGKAVCRVDAFGRAFSREIATAPIQGYSLVLSIDRHIQHLAEKELTRGVKQHRAAAGIVIVMESQTGRILALAGYPDFDCNAYGDSSRESWRNRAVQDVYEPGSTFKVVVASAALDFGIVRLDEAIDCEMGAMKIAGHVYNDHEPYGLLTLPQILEHSSNIGALKLGMRLGEKRLYEALHRFGFGAVTHIDLPGESKGRVRELKKWSLLSVPSISFGQEVSVTSIQILTAINAIANGGYRVRPSVVDRILDERGTAVRTTVPERFGIIRPDTAAAMTNAFESVVLSGTGKRASLEGYRAAGKTGTAQKAGKGGYSKTKYVASFIGFAPLPHPRVTILVQIDEPKGGIYGGDVSAPVFQTIAQEILLRLQVPPDRGLLAAESGPASRLNASDRSRLSLD